MRSDVVILCLLVLVSLTAHGQNKDVPGTQPKDIATVSIDSVRRSFKLGEPIAISVLLKAGGEGVYIEKGWSQAGGAIPGFYVDLETAHGERTPNCGIIVDGIPNQEPDPRAVLARNFIFLSAGEMVGWSTTIDCPPRKPGKYLIRASYSPDRPLNERIAGLAEVRGRVALKILDAKPVEILIR